MVVNSRLRPALKPSKVIITGAAGFIGAHAAARYLDRGIEVIGLDSLQRPGSAENARRLDGSKGFRLERVDIRDAEAVSRVLVNHADVDLVLHTAGQVAVTASVADPREDFEINALGTLNVLEAIRRWSPGAALFYTSTNKVYGALEDLGVSEVGGRYALTERPNGISESQPLEFHSPYGCSKGAADQYVHDYARIYGTRSVVFRQSCIYGTHQFGVEDQGWVAWFTIASVLGSPVTIYGDGKQVRDVLWIDDLLDLYDAAFERLGSVAGRVYNVGGGALSLSLLELLEILRQLRGAPLEIAYAPWRPGDQRVFVSDCAKAASELGWAPKVTPEEGVARLHEWAQGSAQLLRTVLGSSHA